MHAYALITALLAPASALACGGMFCSAAQLQPVEQNAERILFEMHPNGTISTTVEIRYTGDAEDFSWVVPVPDAPKLELVPSAVLRVLDDATAPVLLWQPTTCGEFGWRGRGCSSVGRGPFDEAGAAGHTGDRDTDHEPDGMRRPRSLDTVRDAPERPRELLAPGALAGLAGSPLGCAYAFDAYQADEDYEDPVLVEELPTVGPFESEVVSSDDPAALVDWLNDNGYLLTPAMEPMVAAYVAQNQKFLAMKLAPNAAVSDIAPIRFTYKAHRPTIPLVLTGVSAEPEMGVLAFVAAPQRYQAANHANFVVDGRDVVSDPNNNRSNYYPLVSWLIDELGGHAFVTEYADVSSRAVDDGIRGIDRGLYAASDDKSDLVYAETRQWLLDLGEAHPYLTRLYTRVSGWEMTIDPSFEPLEDASIVWNILDLSEQAPYDRCDPPSFDPCTFQYCGEGGSCAVTSVGTAACVCEDGYTARRIQEPQLGGNPLVDRITCQAESFDLMEGVDFSQGKGDDPCLDVDCGAGECVALNGFPTCDCDDGFAASSLGSAGARCTDADDPMGPEVLLGDEGQVAARQLWLRGADAVALGLVLALPLWVRRRR